jgi:hypothetical protein
MTAVTTYNLTQPFYLLGLQQGGASSSVIAAALVALGILALTGGVYLLAANLNTASAFPLGLFLVVGGSACILRIGYVYYLTLRTRPRV